MCSIALGLGSLHYVWGGEWRVGEVRRRKEGEGGATVSE